MSTLNFQADLSMLLLSDVRAPTVVPELNHQESHFHLHNCFVIMLLLFFLTAKLSYN